VFCCKKMSFFLGFFAWLTKKKENVYHDRRGVYGDTIFEGLHIVSLPWPDNIGSAGTSSHIAEYFDKHGVQVKLIMIMVCFFVLDWVYYVLGFFCGNKTEN
jgi:hypothetical protein